MKTLTPVTLKVDASAIRAYAELTDDFNPLHLDPAFASGTAMGGVIAHGTMSMCLLWQCIAESLGEDALSSAQTDLRFVKPVREGDVLQAGGRLAGAEPTVFDVWVRGADGADRISGTLRVSPASVREAEEAE
jgi:3-hydroxybutyryl-CoA dehydratase